MAKDHQLTAYSPHSELVVIPEVQINESTTMLNEFRNPEIIRRMSCDSVFSQPRRPSILVRPTSRRPTVNSIKESLFINNVSDLRNSNVSINSSVFPTMPQALDEKSKNRKIGEDALSAALSALYAKLIVILGIALPVTDVLSYKGAASFYQGFYLYLYIVSMCFIVFMYVVHLKRLHLTSILKAYPNRARDKFSEKEGHTQYGSFYLRVGTVAFGIGSMVYSGLEFGQYFELKNDPDCQNILIALTPAARMALTILQIQFIFLGSKETLMANHQILSRFGLMHMVATNLCEWLYTLIEETKHEIIHFTHNNHVEESATISLLNSTFSNDLLHNHTLVRRATGTQVMGQCKRSNIMGSLVQNASQFLFPCTIEYSLICAVIFYEMWKKIKDLKTIERSQRTSRKSTLTTPDENRLSVDCSGTQRGVFAGVLVIISLILYFVLKKEKAYKETAILQTTVTGLLLHIITIITIFFAMFKMRDLKYLQMGENELPLDCTLMVVAQSGIYIYCTFSMIGNWFSMDSYGAAEGLAADVLAILQTSLQTLFILNSWWRRCKGAQQKRLKPGRQLITFLLVTNMAMWFTNTLVKSQASFRPSHMKFFGLWAWTVITHVSMPLAIYYRFHSTICLFEIWQSVYEKSHKK